jgi:hypothetical protein
MHKLTSPHGHATFIDGQISAWPAKQAHATDGDRPQLGLLQRPSG